MQIVKLYPECKDNIWGGTLLRDKYGKKTDKEIVAESWELSFHKDGPTRLEDGRTLQEVATAEDFISKLKSALGVFCGGKFSDDVTAVAFDL
jgi:mannose-6-phosphate isomerase